MKITSATTLTWDNDSKKFKTNGYYYYYDISECSTLTFTDDLNRFSFELLIDGLKMNVKTLLICDDCKFKFKDKFMLGVGRYYETKILNKNDIYIGMFPKSTTYTFKSKKSLTKFIGRLCRVEEVMV